MNIWIMRHGEAGFDAPTDSERTLTEKGKNAAFLQGKWLGEQCIPRNIQFDKILVRPYVRAQQTLTALKACKRLVFPNILQILLRNGMKSRQVARLF